MKLNHIYIFLLLLISSRAIGQGRIISGVVSDKVGPLPSASVFEKEFTNNGAITDNRGHFSLKLKGSNNIIVVRCVGYLAKEINVTGKSTIAVTLDDDVKGLEDVVILGYGQKTRKITNTGAISSITGSDIRQSPTASLQNALAGRLPGFFSEQRSGQPGNDGASFQIRGIATYAGTTTPLIIVDDVEFTASEVSQIDPNEIESLTILKDASTTAVYGVRGANGVIVIKTRRGVSGKPMLHFTGEQGLQFPTQRPDVNSGYATLELLRESQVEQYKDPSVTYPQYFSGNNLDHYRLNDDPYNYPNVDWWNVLLKKVSLQNRYNFDISGGTNITKYFISLGYINQGGIYNDFSKDQGYNSNYFYNRYNFRSNLDIDPNKDLHIRVDLSGRFGITNTPNDKQWNNGGTTFQYLWDGELSPFQYPIRWANGLLATSNSTVTKPNPVANLMYSGYDRTYDNDLSIVTQVNQKLDFITKGLAINGLISYDSDYNFTRSLHRSGSGTNEEIMAYVYNAATKSYQPWNPNSPRLGYLVRSGTNNPTNRLLNVQASLTYNRSFGNNNFNGLVLLNQTSTTTDAIVSSVPVAGDPSHVRGITAKLDYNYKHKYLLGVDGAYNGSDRFRGSKQYQLFPVVSAGWNIAEESFFKNNVKFIDALKFRGSYGLVGNDGVGSNTLYYQKSYSTNNSGTYYFGQTPTASNGMVEPTLGNTNITWEQERDLDVGMDLTMFNGKLAVTTDYYSRRRSNILTQPGTIPATFGASFPPYNLGIVSNKGFEVDVTYRQRINKDLSVNVNGNVSYSQNKIIYEDLPSVLYPWLAVTGKPVGAQFGYTATGFYQSLAQLYSAPRQTTAVPLSNLQLGSLMFKDLNGDGKIDQNDAGYLGTNQPTFTGGLSFGFSYKSFDFSTVFQGSFGNIINISRGIIAYTRPDRQSIPYNLGRWTPVTAQSADFPELSGSISNSQTSSYWYKKGDYVRWKTYELGYNFSHTIVKKLHISSLRVYTNGYNMALLYTALPVFIDPESVVSSSAGEYPQQRIINFGIQVGL